MPVPIPELVGALVGGALIGLSALALLLLSGRIAGVSGIVGGLLPATAGDARWRLAFVGGLVLGGGLLALAHPAAFPPAIDAHPLLLAVAGLLVGLGSRLGNGCTSGHGVCGIGRLSTRSLFATLTFMTTAVVTVWLTRHVLGAMS